MRNLVLRNSTCWCEHPDVCSSAIIITEIAFLLFSFRHARNGTHVPRSSLGNNKQAFFFPAYDALCTPAMSFVFVCACFSQRSFEERWKAVLRGSSAAHVFCAPKRRCTSFRAVAYRFRDGVLLRLRGVLLVRPLVERVPEAHSERRRVLSNAF